MVINGAGVVGHYLESLFILLQHLKLPLKASFMGEVGVRAEEPVEQYLQKKWLQSANHKLLLP